MKLKEFDILLDIKRHKKIEYFEIVQGDYESNILKISLVEDLNEYVLSGLKVEIAFAKSDGTTVLQDLNNGISLLGNKIICTLKTNTIASPGKVLAEVRVLEETKLLTSSRFSFFVRQAIVNDETIESTNEFPILEQLTNSVTGIIASEEERVKNEEERKLAEQNREVIFKEYDTRITEVEIKSNKNTDHIIELEQDLTQHKEEYTNQRQQDQLKVATVEKDIDDYKSTMASVNVNQEAKQKVSGYGIVSLPKTAANGQVSVELKGMTVTNIAPDSKCEVLGEGLVNAYLAAISLNTSDKLFGNSSKKISSSGNGSAAYINKPVQKGKHWFASAFVKNISAPEITIRFRRSSTGSIVKTGQSHSSLDWKRIGVKITSNEIGEFDDVNLNITTTSTGANQECLIDGVMLIEIPNEDSLLSENELLKKYSYIPTGTKSTVSASRLKSVSPDNIFDGILDSGGLDSNNGNNITDANRVRCRNHIKISSNTPFIIKDFTNVGSIMAYRFYDINKNFISGSSVISGNPVTTPTNCEYLRFAIVSVTNINSQISIVKSNIVPTIYKPYTESTQYLPNVGELRSLPNGTKDEISLSEGKAIIRTRETKLNELVYSSTITSHTDIDIIRYLRPNNMSTLKTNKSMVVDGMQESIAMSLIELKLSDIGKYATTTSTGYIDFIVSKGTTKTQLESSINMSTLLTYQLAEPIITPIQVSGTLLSNPSGTVYVENVVADAGIYTTKFDIKELQLPIKSIDKLIKYNFATGVQTILDTSLAVINADKKSFTHPKLAKNDMVFVDYYYDVEGTLAETTIEYLDSRHTIKDTTNNKFYSWNIKSTNGVATVALTEVL